MRPPRGACHHKARATRRERLLQSAHAHRGEAVKLPAGGERERENGERENEEREGERGRGRKESTGWKE